MSIFLLMNVLNNYSKTLLNALIYPLLFFFKHSHLFHYLNSKIKSRDHSLCFLASTSEPRIHSFNK